MSDLVDGHRDPAATKADVRDDTPRVTSIPDLDRGLADAMVHVELVASVRHAMSNILDRAMHYVLWLRHEELSPRGHESLDALESDLLLIDKARDWLRFTTLTDVAPPTVRFSSAWHEITLIFDAVLRARDIKIELQTEEAGDPLLPSLVARFLPILISESLAASRATGTRGSQLVVSLDRPGSATIDLCLDYPRGTVAEVDVVTLFGRALERNGFRFRVRDTGPRRKVTVTFEEDAHGQP